MPKEELVFQFNEDSLEVKSEISSGNEKEHKISSSASSVKTELNLQSLSQSEKKRGFDEDSIISVVN